MSKSKELGQVFTPDWVVEVMIKTLNINLNTLPEKTFFEPSFGKGVFLSHLIQLYVQYGNKYAIPTKNLSSIIDNSLYGIELDKELYEHTLMTLKEESQRKFNLFLTLPNLVQGDALDYNLKTDFDYIIGNPPYVRIHNIEPAYRDKLKQHFIYTLGTSDLYVIFFEKCLQLLHPQGELIFITPNSWIRNVSQAPFREHLLSGKKIAKVIDFGSSKVFEGVGTYTAITHMKNSQPTQDKVEWEEWEGKKQKYSLSIPYNSLQVNPRSSVIVSHGVYDETTPGKLTLKNKSTIQNGLATLGDKYFLLSETAIKEKELESKYIKPIVKCSTYKGSQAEVKRIFFPYSWNPEISKWVGLQEEQFKDEAPNLYSYFLPRKQELEARSLDAHSLWFWYGRSQALQATGCRKLIIPHTVAADARKLSTHIVPSGTLGYSGLFATETQDGLSLEEIQTIIESPDFTQYVKKAGKDLAQGYKTFSSRVAGRFPIDKWIQ